MCVFVCHFIDVNYICILVLHLLLILIVTHFVIIYYSILSTIKISYYTLAVCSPHILIKFHDINKVNFVEIWNLRYTCQTVHLLCPLCIDTLVSIIFLKTNVVRVLLSLNPC